MNRRSLWLLLVLALFPAGWFLGQLPGPKPRAPGAAAPYAPTVGAGAPSASFPAADQPSRWTTLDLAMAESRQSGKPVMLDFNAEWCGPCQMMRRQVFEAGGRGEAVLAAVIPVSIVDRYREDGRNSEVTESLQRRYRIQAFPTLVVFSPRTGRTESTRGYRGADWTVSWIRNAAQQVR